MPAIDHYPQAIVVVLDAEQTDFSGDLDGLRQLLIELVAVGRPLVIDLAAARTLNGAFLGLLAAIYIQAGRQRSRFVVCGADSFCAELLRICGLDRVWEIYPNSRIALDRLGTTAY